MRDIVFSGLSDRASRRIHQQFLESLIAEQKAKLPANLTVDELHEIADQLTLKIRQNGYKFHVVYLPEQEVHRGLVKLTYIGATLSDIHIINNSQLDTESVREVFLDLLDKELYIPAVENKVYALKAQRGVQVFAFFSRGKSPGEIRLNISLNRSKSPWYSLHTENYGNESSGKHRLIGNIRLNHLLADFDRFNLTVFQSIDGENSTFAHASYYHTLPNLHSAIRISAGDNQYELGKQFTPLELSGKSRTYRLDFYHSLSHVPLAQKRINVGVYEKNSELESDFSATLDNEEKSTAGLLGLSWTTMLGKINTQVNFGVDLVRGEYETALTEASPTFEKAEYFFNISPRSQTTSLFAIRPTLYLRGQYSQEDLPGLENVSLSGPYAVRAFPSGDYAADSAVVGSINLHYDGLAQLIKHDKVRFSPFLFYDKAKGYDYSNADEKTTTDLAGYGIGINIRAYDFSASISYAKPEENSLLGNEESDDQWLFELRWH